AVRAVGGIDALKLKIAAMDAASNHAGSRLAFFPDLHSAWMPALTFFVYLAVNWWASWYPGAEPGGGGYVAQRIFSAKDERHGMLATLAAAYMSTIGTQLNWGASYVINDFYRRFWVRGKGERHYVIISQVVTVLLMVLSLLVTLQLESIGDAWKLLLVIGAGTGPVLLLRWFWWRMNAWSEIAAMLTA